MDMSINLKRRNREDSPTKEGEKRNPKKTTQQQSPSLPQPKGVGKKKIAKSPATNERPAQIIPPLPQKQKITPINPIEIPLPPSLSPITTPKIFTRSHSVTRLSPDPQTASTSSSGQKPRARSASTETRHAMTAFLFCEDILENPNHDHILKTSLKPLRSFKKINNKDVTNPYIFKDAPMLTTFVRSAGNRKMELYWRSQPGGRNAGQHKKCKIKKNASFLFGQGPDFSSPIIRKMELYWRSQPGGRNAGQHKKCKIKKNASFLFGQGPDFSSPIIRKMELYWRSQPGGRNAGQHKKCNVKKNASFLFGQGPDFSSPIIL